MRFFLTLLLAAGFLLAQAQRADSLPRTVRLGLLGNLNRSNSNTAYLLKNDAGFSTKNSRRKFNLDAAWLYGEQGSRLTNNDVTATADFNLYPDSSRLYYWALANFTSSYSLRIVAQGQAGAGAAFNFVDSKKAWLNLSEGLLYETSRVNKGDTASTKYYTFRNSLRLSYKFELGPLVTLRGSNFWQPALGKPDDYILRTVNSLGVKLNRWISFNASLTYNQFKRTNTENLLFTYGLFVEKSF